MRRAWVALCAAALSVLCWAPSAGAERMPEGAFLQMVDGQPNLGLSGEPLYLNPEPAAARSAASIGSRPHARAARSRAPFFSASSIWNRRLSRNEPLDPNSQAIVQALDEEVEHEGPRNMLNVNTTAWSVPIYTVPKSEPTVRVKLEKPNGELTSLQSAWEEVPLPPGAEGAKGSDKHLVVWQPSTDKMWEFWHFEQTAEGPQAEWGGAMEDVSGNGGYYNSQAWPHAQTGWGATASSLPLLGGLITLKDLESGRIKHALAIALPNPRAGVYALPAQRTDGTSTSPLSLPEGAHLRLDPSLKLGSLHLPHVVLELAKAAQRYGIVVRDHSANITLYAQDPTPTGTNPYAASRGYFEGRCACSLMQAFPWADLQLLKMELAGS
jgi:hypothetical protein